MGMWLWSIIPWGYQVLLALEAMRSSALNVFLAAITDLGSEMAYLVILSVVYWCVDKGVGQGLAYAYLSAMVLNAWIKDLFAIPRPDDPALEGVLEEAGITERLRPLRHEDTPSFVSGHTQGAIVVWGYMAYRFKKIWFTVVAIILIALIGFSRMYLGAHFPQDVVGGLLIGAAYLIAFLWAEPYVRRWLSGLALGWRYALAVLIPLALLLIHPADNAVRAMGAAVGLGVGYVLEGQTVRFNVEGEWWRRVLRGALGLVVLLMAYMGLSALFGAFDERMGEAMARVWYVVRYALVGFAGAWIAPWAFTQAKLARRTGPSTGGQRQ